MEGESPPLSVDEVVEIGTRSWERERRLRVILVLGLTALAVLILALFWIPTGDPLVLLVWAFNAVILVGFNLWAAYRFWHRDDDNEPIYPMFEPENRPPH